MRQNKTAGVSDRYQNGCSVGIANLRYGDVDKFKSRLQEVLEVNSRQSVDVYIKGKVYIPVVKAMAIEKVFSEFGILEPEKIWGKVRLPKTQISQNILDKARMLD